MDIGYTQAVSNVSSQGPWVPERPLSPRARGWVVIVLVGVGLLWLLWFQAHRSLPEQVPVHFNWEGAANDYGNRLVLLYLPVLLSLVPLLLLVLVRFRFVLVNRWPHWVNLPAFFLYAPLLEPERRAVWLNRYFEVLLLMDVELTVFFVFLEWGILQGARTGRLPPWFTAGALGLPLVLGLSVVWRFLRLGQELRQEAETRSSGALS